MVENPEMLAVDYPYAKTCNSFVKRSIIKNAFFAAIKVHFALLNSLPIHLFDTFR